MKCCICGCGIRTFTLPDYLKFWIPLARVYKFNQDDYIILSFMCPKDFTWANKYPQVANSIVYSKAQAQQKDENNGD